MLVACGKAPPAAQGAGIPFDAFGGTVTTLAPLLEQVTPAVVNISVVSRSPVADNPMLRDPFFRRFFNIPEEYGQERTQVSAGSGVIIDSARGYVLTNHHVVANGLEIYVTLKDRRRFRAQLVGSDEATDIALLTIDADGLSELPFGDSSGLRVGDFVIAIGNPFGLGQTVTSGIVSALGRTGLKVGGYEDFIQTDASINPGNSGGALIDLRGQLVGINTAILSPRGGNIGIGFAVPSNMARGVMDQLTRFGEVRRGRLGVTVQDVTPDMGDALGIETGAGALVAQVEPGSAADQAGILSGDVIVAIDGQPVTSATALRNRVGLIPLGETVDVSLIRRGRALSIVAIVGRQARR
ncbi:MAG: Do family serine endopeptidase [Rhodospirillales bacterium]|nr:Do family serine endopeptidase [Rhodospirillales bacterium]